MKQFLVGIDFSKTSIHALEYAIFLANTARADIVMVWVDDFSTPESMFSEAICDIRDESKRNFEEIIEKYKASFTGGKLTYKLKKGKAYHEIATLARQNNTDLIFVGTHGVTGFEEFWIGSNAYRIVINAPCPVITIRQEFDFSHGISKVVLPIDHTKNTCQKVPFSSQIAKMLNAEIHILAIYATTLKTLHKKVDQTVNDVRKTLEEQNIKTYFESCKVENIAKATIAYTEKIKAGVIAIMTDQETTVSRILLGEYSQQMINNSPVPVLSIHPDEIYNKTSL